MKTLKIVTALWVLAVSTLSASAFTTVKCDTDPVFAANSCNQCFTWTDRGEWSYLWNLKDEWINNTTSDKIMLKEEQEMPKMINLAPSLVKWEQNPTSKDFWEYSPELNNIYDKENEGYVLHKGKKVNWIQSKKGYSFALTKNKAEQGKKIGLLTYVLATHNLSKEWDINTDSDEQKECVLFKSGKKVEKAAVIPGKKSNTNTPVKTSTKKLPKTWPEHYLLLLLLSMILGFGIMKMRKSI